jgi:flagellar hook-associated protein 1 FlgK
MSSLGSLLNTARDGLAAQSYGLGVTGQNISNVSTPEYVRREAVLETRQYGGVNAAGLRRITDQWTERKMFESASLSSAADERDRHLASVESVFNDFGGVGLGNSLDAMFSSFSALGANPSDPTVRANVLDKADAFASRSRDMAEQLATQSAQLLEQAKATAAEVNQRAAQVAKLNRQISAAEALDQDAADLRDQRNKLLLDMSQFVDVRTFTDGNGGLVVQAAGTTLVEGDTARSLSISLGDDGKMRVWSQYKDSPPTDVTAFLTGGKLAGIKEARDEDLFEVAARFDQFVFDVTTAVNEQHAQGFGMDGETGRNLFAALSSSANAARNVALDPEMFGNPERVAASDSATGLPGNGQNALDLFAVGRRALAASGVRTAAEEYSAIVGDVGLKRANSMQAVETRAAIHAQVEKMREGLSGVSLDEEFVALTKFQRAYEASGKVLSVADELLADLIARVG